MTSPKPSVPERVLAFIRERGEGSPHEIAEHFVLNHGTVRSTMRRMLDEKRLSQDEFGRYTLPSSGDSRAGSAPVLPAIRTTSPDAPPQSDDLVTYPYAPHGHKGGWAGRSNAGMEGTEVISLPRSFLMARLGRVPDPERTYWTHVVGDSMMPWLRDGQMIGVERDNEIRADGRHALYLDDAEEEIVKRVSRLGGKRVKLSADNLTYGWQEIQHLEDDMYRDVNRGHTLRMRVLGRIIEPPDDAQSIFATAIAAVRGFTA